MAHWLPFDDSCDDISTQPTTTMTCKPSEPANVQARADTAGTVPRNEPPSIIACSGLPARPLAIHFQHSAEAAVSFAYFEPELTTAFRPVCVIVKSPQLSLAIEPVRVAFNV